MASDKTPVIQILDRAEPARQTLLPLPSSVPYPLLTASSTIRIRTTVLALTSNTFTYCRVGEAWGYWKFHPLPPNLPEPFASNVEKYGRVPCWGYARVLASTATSRVPEGSFVSGYLPIGTLAQDLEVDEQTKHEEGPHRIRVSAPHRKKLMGMYQNYTVVLPGTEMHRRIEAAGEGSDDAGLDAICGIMHQTAYLMAEGAFQADDASRIYPGVGLDLGTGDGGWTSEWADLEGATVVCFAPGAKVALSFTHLLRKRSVGKPAKLVGVASEFSKAFVEGTGLYDVVLSTTEGDGVFTNPYAALGVSAGAGKKTKVVVVDFGGRAGAAVRFTTALKAALVGDNDDGKIPVDTLRYIAVGVEIGAGNPLPDEVTASTGPILAAVNGVQINADDMLKRLAAKKGAQAVYEGQAASFQAMKDEGGIPGFKLQWGHGMEAVKDKWDAMARNEVPSDVGLAFKI